MSQERERYAAADDVRSRTHAGAAQLAPELSARVPESHDAIVHALQLLLQEILGYELDGLLNSQQSILEHGLDSLRMAELQYAIEQKFGVSMPLSQLVDGPSTDELAIAIAEQGVKRGQSSASPAGPQNGDLVSGHLSHEQEGIWVTTQFAGGDRAYREQVLLRLRGPLQADHLCAAIQELVTANEALRTAFVTGKDGIFQQIRPRVDADVTESTIDAASDDALIAKLVDESLKMAAVPFVLETPPLVRFHLFHLGAHDHALLVTAHHLIADGRALEILGSQLEAAYNSVIGNVGPKPRLANVSCLEHSTWQRSAEGHEEIQKSISYWKECLKDAPERLALPYDKSGSRSYRGRRLDRVLPANVTQALSSLAKTEMSTLFMVYSAAYAALLSELSGQARIIFGIPVANRNRAESRHVVGQFANTVPVVIDCSGSPTFRVQLGRAKHAVLGALDHQNAPFRFIAKYLPHSRNVHDEPRLQAALSLLPPFSLLRLEGIEARPVPIGQPIAKCDLAMEVYETDTGTGCSVLYDSSRFAEETMNLVLDRYVSILSAVGANPEYTVLRENKAKSPSGAIEINGKSKTAGIPVQAVSNLSDDQLLVWSGQKLHPDKPLYNIAGLNRFRGEIDLTRLRRAFETLVAETDALRTVILEFDSVPIQRVLTHNPRELEIVDFSSDTTPELAFQKWLAERLTRVLPMETSLYDAVLVRLAHDDTVLYLVTHHIISDGVSRGLARRRLAELYNSDLSVMPPHAVAMAFQNYVHRQIEYRQTPDYQRHREYWQAKLSLPLEPLTFYGVRPSRDDLRTCRIEVPVGVHRIEKLLRIAETGPFQGQSVRSSLLNALSTVLSVLVHRIGGSDTFILGTHMHNRNDVAFKSSFGLFMRELPLRIQIEQGESFVSVASKIKSETNDSGEHTDICPFGTGRRPERLVTINFLRIGSQEQFGASTAEPLYISHGFGTDVLSLLIHDYSGHGVDGLSFDFQTATFTAQDQERLIGHFLNLLDAFLNNPNQPIDLSALPSRHEVEFLPASVERPENRACVWKQIRERVEQFPQRNALTRSEGRTKTYGELEHASRQLAQFLLSQGLQAGTRVGVCLDRSFDMVFSILAITRIGGVYVPMDPLSPARRLATISGNLRVRAILTSERMKDKFEGYAGLLISLDTASYKTTMDDNQRFNHIPTESDLVYAISTSGSTGEPKTAGVYHRSFANLVGWYVDELGMSADDVVHVVSAMSFDLTQKNLFAPLTIGAGIYLSEAEIFDPEIVTREILHAGVTWMNTTPAHFYSLLEHNRGDYSSLRSLRRVVLGGEPIDPHRLREWYESMDSGALKVVNTYGPTECTDVVAFHVLTEEDIRGSRPAPIGRAVDRVSLYVLDRNRNPVPNGVRGRLWIGGAAIGAGYLDNYGETDRSFAPDPFNGTSGKMYDTGDNVRRLPDGNLDFLGREDNQIKHRGVRLDLAEMESILRQHSSVSDAVVGRANDSGLIAYILPADRDNPVPVSELRAMLSSHLPSYCLPTHYRLLGEWPLTRTGKVNRSALSSARSEEFTSQEPHEPRTDQEKLLAVVWCEILRIPSVGIEENFFELGGDSLMALQMLSSIRGKGLYVSPRDFFERPSITGLIRSVANSAQRFRELGHEGVVPLSPIQRWFLERKTSNPHLFNQAILLETPLRTDVDAMAAAVEALVANHGALRSRFSRWSDEWMQVILPEEPTETFKHVDLSGTPHASRAGEILRRADEIHRRIHIGQGPVFQFALFTFGPGDPGRLLMVAHHLVVDGVSWRVLTEDLLSHYLRIREKQTAPRRSIATDPWRVWARRLSEFAKSPEQRAELSFWNDARYDRLVPVPYDFDPAIANNLARYSGEERAELTAEETRQLLAAAPERFGASVQDLLVGALAFTLHRWSGSNPVLMDMEGHGREPLFDDVDISRTIGWFTAIYPVLIEADAPGNLGDFVRAAAQSLRGVPKHGVGFGLLKYLGCEEDREILDRLPPAKVAFNFMGPLDGLNATESGFRFVAQGIGKTVDPDTPRVYETNVNCYILDGKLRIVWRFSTQLHRVETVVKLLECYRQALEELAG